MRFLACVVFAASTLVLGCGGSSPTSPTSPSTPAAATINIVGENGTQAFSPNPADLDGQMVVFRNAHSITHRVILNDGSIDTGDIPPGGTSGPVMMPVSGANYHCSIHPGMIGAVRSSSGGDAPACTGPFCVAY